MYSNELLGDTSKLYQYSYDVDKKEISKDNNDVIEITNNCTKEGYSCIETNLQTLVSNGFLSGSTDGNKQKVILNVREDNANMGNCSIKIVRVVNSSSNKVSYKVYAIENSDEKNICPAQDEYDKGVSYDGISR